MVPVEMHGLVYFTPNWKRFYLGRPELERLSEKDRKKEDPSLAGRVVRPIRRWTFTEVKHPKVLKQLRRLAP